MIFDLTRHKSAQIAAMGEGEAVVGGGESLTLTKLMDLLNLKGVPKSKLSEATYFACLRMLSEGLGRLPLKLLQSDRERGVVERSDLSLYHTLRTRPNPFVTATRFWGTVELHRNHYGNAYVWLQPDGDTFRLWQLPSEQVTVWWDDRHIMAEQSYLWYIWSAPNGQKYKFCHDEVMHFRSWLSMDGIVGLPVRDILTLTLEGAQKSQTMLNALYDNGFTAKIAVQYTGDIDPKREESFTRNLTRYATGQVNGAQHIIPIPLGARVEPLNVKLTDGQFLELRKYTALQVAAAFGIKPDQINDYTKSSYASSEAQQLAFLVDTQLYILKDYEEEIGAKLLTEEQRRRELLYPSFNTAVVLRADTKTQIEALTRAVGSCVYTPNEARAFLSQPAKPGGDRLYANGNLIPLEDAGKQYRTKNPSPEGGGENRK